MNKQLSCEEKIDQELNSRIKDFKNALNNEDDFIEWLNDYALAYEDDPHYRAKKLELSYGGPADGFRFFEDGTIQYYYQDWFDGAIRTLYGEDYKIMLEVYENYLDI